MNTSSDMKIEKPSIIQALLSGFNTIANKPDLILIPIILDLFLWFGPAWRVDRVFAPLIRSLGEFRENQTMEITAILDNYQVILRDILANFNLAASLRTMPIGVPSLMISKPSFLNPLGQPLTFSLETNTQLLGYWFVFLLTGFFLGNVYFQNISNQIIDLNNHSIKSLMQSFLQIIILPLLLFIILIILTIPMVLLVSLVTLISPAISQLILLIAGTFILWAIMPLIFTPHGIFLYRQNIIAAMITSIKVVRLSMGQTAWFFLSSFLLVEGFNYLWRSPNVDNWFLIIGILGHAFITSAVIAASFHYFIDATKYSQSLINQKMQSI